MTARLAADISTLAAMPRGSASAGEKAAAQWAQTRLYEAGIEDVALEPYRWPRTYAWSHLIHLAGGLLPRASQRAVAAGLYELAASGRLDLVPRVLPPGDGLNCVARIPARGVVERTFVLVAHLDTQRSGFMWDPRLARHAVRRRAQAPAGLLSALAIASGRRGLLALVAAALLDTALRGRPVPGANDNASGVAAVLEVARRLAADPLDGCEVLVALVGAEESGMGGMRAFLAEHPLDPERSFVLGLDTVGSGLPVIARAEGTVLPHRYRARDLEVVERGAHAAGFDAPERWRVGAWTDPILARFAGVPAASMLSVGADGAYTNYHRPSDLPEHVDHDCVARCAAIAEATARLFACG